MATSKKKDRVQNLMQLRNTLAGGIVTGHTHTEDKRVAFPEPDHKLMLAHLDSMLADEGIFRIG